MRKILFLLSILFLSALPAQAQHRYWRIFMSGGSFVSINTIIYYNSSGTILAGNGTQPGTASASSSFGGLPPSNAFDNDDTTLWATSSGPVTNEWIEEDFASAVSPAYVLIGCRYGFCSQGSNQTMYTFKIQYSDNNSTWTDATGSFAATWLLTGGAYNGSRAFFTFPISAPSAGSYTNWRVVDLASANGKSGYAELSLATSIGGSNVATGGRAFETAVSSGSIPGTHSGDVAFDGNTSTYWESSGNGAYVAYAFPQAYNIQEIKITAPPSGNQDDAPSLLALEGSNDSVNWVTTGLWSTGSWTAGQQKTFDVAALPSPVAWVDGATNNYSGQSGAPGNASTQMTVGTNQLILMAYHACNQATAPSTFTSATLGITYTKLATQGLGSGQVCSGGTVATSALYWACSGASSGADTLSVAVSNADGNGGAATFALVAYNVLNCTSPLDGSIIHTGGTSSGSQTAGNITTSGNNGIVVTAGFQDYVYPSAPTAGSGYTLRYGVLGPWGSFNCGTGCIMLDMIEDQTSTSAGTYATNFTFPTTNGWSILGQAFLPNVVTFSGYPMVVQHVPVKQISGE